ncbi:MAG: SMP-30/gluconolactonase/LRE family protein [Bacteroidota bacterium]
MKTRIIIISLFIAIALFSVAVIAILVQTSPLNPIAWIPPEPPQLTGALSQNELLSTSEKVSLHGWQGPEDIAIDKEGNIYTGVHEAGSFDSGVILKIDPEGNYSTFCNTDSWVLGLHFDKQGNLIACDSKRGLISINKEGDLTVLAQEDEHGNPILIPNDVDIASNGMIYFSNSSSRVRFSMENVMKIIMEARSDGGLYRYNPETKQVTTLVDSSFFGNGVAVSRHDDFVLMVDLTKYRVLKYHLKGPKKGNTETFLDNLPGFPNGISRRPDGSFWLGFSTKRDTGLDRIHPQPYMKKLVYNLPKWAQPQQVPYGMVMHLSESGEILNTFYDTKGKVVREASSIEEYDGHIYVGGDWATSIIKYKLGT